MCLISADAVQPDADLRRRNASTPMRELAVLGSLDRWVEADHERRGAAGRDHESVASS
jgi:hypothetical protein